MSSKQNKKSQQQQQEKQKKQAVEKQPKKQEEVEEDEDEQFSDEDFSNYEVDLERVKEQEKKVESAKKKGNKEEEANLLPELIDVYLQVLNDFEQAFKYAKREVELRKQLKQVKELVKAEGSLVSVHQARGELDEAEKVLKASLEAAQKSKDAGAEVQALTNYGAFYLNQFELKNSGADLDDDSEDDDVKEEKEEEEKEEDETVYKAIQYAESALKICYDKSTTDELMNSEAARLANTIASEAYTAIGEIEKALPHYERIVEIARSTENELFEALGGLARIYFESADSMTERDEEGKINGYKEGGDQKKVEELVKKSITTYEEAVKLGEKEGPDADPDLMTACFAGLVSCYELIKDKKKMIDAQKRLIEAQAEVGEPDDVCTDHITLAEMYAENGQQQLAMETLKLAKKIAQENQLEEQLDDIEEISITLQTTAKDSLKGKKKKTA